MDADSPPPSRPVTLEDVARVAGVSRATVSRVINETPTVDRTLRNAVENAVAATGYVPNRAARSLVTRRTGSVALVVSEQEKRHAAAPSSAGCSPTRTSGASSAGWSMCCGPPASISS